MKPKRERPPDHKSVVELTKAYVKAEDKIRAIIFEPKAVSLASAKKQIDKTLTEAEKRLSKVNKTFGQELKAAYKNGIARANGANTGTGAGAQAGRADQDFGKDVRRGAFIDLQGGMLHATAELRKAVADAIRSLDTGNKNLWAFTEAIKRTFAERDILEVRYQNGAAVKLDHYAKMLARSSRIETENLGMLNRAREQRCDIVELIGTWPTCELCATLRNRKFSISGTDKRFPPLYGTVFKDGYHTIHPNCRCELVPWHEELYTPEEVEKAVAESNRPFEDNRTKREIDAYASWQAGNRQRWSEQAEYGEMKRLLGDKMPYKTLGGFRAAKRGFNDRVKAGKLDKNAAAEYNKYAKTKRALRDKKLQAEIVRSYPKTIEHGKQGKHIRGHNNYREGKSYLTIDETEAQELVDRYAGQGEIKRSDKGRWVHKELVIADKYIGYHVSQDGKRTRTKAFMIHYSKKGTHIVPAKRRLE